MPPDPHSTTPLPTRRAVGLLLAGAVLATLALGAMPLDLPLARYVQQHHLPGDLARLVRLAEAFAYGGTVALIILTAARLDSRGWRVLPRLILGAYGAGLAADLTKLLVARSRPSASDLSGSAGDTFLVWLPQLAGDHLRHLNLAYGWPLQSFPSAHTATAVGLAIALAILYPRGWWLFALLALLAALQRIVSQSHFLSDVLAGAALGFLVAACSAGLPPLARWLAHLEAPRDRPGA